MMASIELSATYEAAREIGPWLTSTLTELEAPQLARVGELELAIHELAINIIDHAYDDTSRPQATYTIELDRHDETVVAKFRDQGGEFANDHEPPGDEPSVRGYGLMIAEQLATSIDYERVDDVNHWTVTFGP